MRPASILTRSSLILVMIAACITATPLHASTAPATKPSPRSDSRSTPHRADRARSDKGAQTQPAASHGPLVAWIEISGELAEAPPAVAWAGEDAGHPTLRGVIQQIDRVRRERRHAGAVIYLDQAELEMAQVDEIAEAVRGARAAGKKIVFFAEAYDLRSYLLACSGDRIVLQEKGSLAIHGLGVEEMYVAGLLDKIGVKADLLQVGNFKGARDPMTRQDPSPEWSLTIDALLDDLYNQATARIAEARHLTAAQVEQAMAECMSLTDKELLKRKLVDALSNRSLDEQAALVFGDEFDWDDSEAHAPAALPMDNPFALLRMMLQPSQAKAERPSIAVINATGVIQSGESGEGGMGFGEAGIGSRTFCDAVDQAMNDELVRGVVIRIDSPGGSALASEVMWQAVRQMAEVKPVYVSIGSMAASGGYYVAAAGQRIYVSSGSIVGSIGVVGGKVVLGGLYEKLGVKVHRRSRGPMGDMFNSVEPFTPAQRTAVEASMRHTYEQFIDRVKRGRGDRIKDLDAVAQGRIFSGRKAIENGMADREGGMAIAIRDLAKDLKLKPGSYDIINLPPPLTLPEYLEQVFDRLSLASPGAGDAARGASMDVSTLTAIGTVLGPRRWSAARRSLQGLMLLHREPSVLLLPVALSWE